MMGGGDVRKQSRLMALAFSFKLFYTDSKEWVIWRCLNQIRRNRISKSVQLRRSAACCDSLGVGSQNAGPPNILNLPRKQRVGFIYLWENIPLFSGARGFFFCLNNIREVILHEIGVAG